MVKLGILGAGGRMGQMVQKIAGENPNVEVVAKVSQDDTLESLLDTDLVIDFSLPKGSVAFAKLLEKSSNPPAWAIGTTGFSEGEVNALATAAKKAPVLWATNFSAGIMLLNEAVRKVTPAMSGLGFQPKVHEIHHIHKKDKPSGTAKTLVGILKENYSTDILVDAQREGETVGVHTVTFESPTDSLSFTHVSKDRSIYARGAIEVGLWLREQHPGKLRTLQDYFNERFS